MATTFPQFSLLPKEIRLTIWSLALEPRIVELCFRFNEQDVEVPDNLKEGPITNSEAEGETNDGQDPESAEISRPVVNEINEVIEEEESSEDSRDDDEDSSPVLDDGAEDPPSPFLTKPGYFYSPSPLPSLLRVNAEARSIALAASLPSFPVRMVEGAESVDGDESVKAVKQDVFYNPEIDILYFPAWCWPNDVLGFEVLVGERVKGAVRRIAVENLMWMSYWSEGTANDQITISQFKNLKEFIFAVRELTECGCCVEWDEPEKGLIEFVEIITDTEIKTEGLDQLEKGDGEVTVGADPETDRANDESRLGAENGALSVVVPLARNEGDEVAKKGNHDYTKRCLEKVDEEFKKIKEADEEWSMPKARFLRLKRDGVFMGDPYSTGECVA